MNYVISPMEPAGSGPAYKSRILKAITALIAAAPGYADKTILPACADVYDRDPGESPPWGDDPGDSPPNGNDTGSIPPDLEDGRKLKGVYVPGSILPKLNNFYAPESILPLDEKYKKERPKPEPYGPYVENEEGPRNLTGRFK
jgi:hypothetical protein